MTPDTRAGWARLKSMCVTCDTVRAVESNRFDDDQDNAGHVRRRRRTTGRGSLFSDGYWNVGQLPSGLTGSGQNESLHTAVVPESPTR
jgi:hypothetical protein